MERSASTVLSSLRDPQLPDSQAIKYYTEQNIAELIESLTSKTAVLKDETDLFRRYADRITQGKGFRKERGIVEEVPGSQEPMQLTAEQKADIASHEADELKQELQRLEKKAIKQADKYECKMIECENFKELVVSQNKDFDHKIVLKGASGERLQKWLEDCGRHLESTFRSQMLNNQSNQAHIRALIVTLHKQQELGENLAQVDFMKVEIENRLLVENYEKTRRDIQDTNRENNKTSLALADLTQKSIQLSKTLQSGQDKLKNGMEIIHRLEKEKADTDEMGEKFRDWNRKAKERSARCPSIAVYIQIEKDIELLEQLIKDSARKVQIVEMSTRLKSKVSQPEDLEAIQQRKVFKNKQLVVFAEGDLEPYEFPAITGTKHKLLPRVVSLPPSQPFAM